MLPLLLSPLLLPPAPGGPRQFTDSERASIGPRRTPATTDGSCLTDSERARCDTPTRLNAFAGVIDDVTLYDVTSWFSDSERIKGAGPFGRFWMIC